MLFNPDPKKPTHGVIFSMERNEETHCSVFYNNIEVSQIFTDSQKRLGLVLDNKLTFKNILRINWIKRILVLVR